mmetsp:Transcript_39812/g.71594  ORF Transcript_39812/g.71594 Transcript_39812/m.71594 type:complete len:102 (+) Transcript_39812:51-356(+)
MPDRLTKVYSAPSLGSSTSSFDSLQSQSVRRREFRKFCHETADRSTMQLTAEKLDTQSSDVFVASAARESVRRTRLLQINPPASHEKPFWLRKERRIDVWR